METFYKNISLTLTIRYELRLSILVLLITLSGTSQLPLGLSSEHFLPKLKECHNCMNKTWSIYNRPELVMEDLFNVQSFTWEFTQIAPVPSPDWEYTTTSNDKKLPKLIDIVGDEWINMIEMGATYDVRIRANYVYGGSSDYGELSCLQVASGNGGAPNGPGDDDNWFAEAAISLSDLYCNQITIYPNPCNGEYFNLSISELESDSVFMDIVNLQGKTVDHQEFKVKQGKSFAKQIFIDFDSGNYMVNLKYNGQEHSTQLVVIK